VYGFYKECVEKYDSPRVWFMISDVFDYFALAATINDSIYCVHGGLSPSLMYIDQIHILDRFQEMPEIGPITDMLWSDPETDGQTDYFVPSKRGAGYRFGAEVVKRFLYVNKMSHILRAHQLCMNGYNASVVFNDLLTTVWSAPNYCYRMRNSASILQVGFNLE
ncbi:putative serine/threonine protein phosphatase, partial [Spiromyces aspiralis]